MKTVLIIPYPYTHRRMTPFLFSSATHTQTHKQTPRRFRRTVKAKGGSLYLSISIAPPINSVFVLVYIVGTVGR